MSDTPFPFLNEFEAHFAAGESQLVWSWVSADTLTPVSAYMKLCGDSANCFLLESVEGGETLGRYSVIGLNPDLLIRTQGTKCDVRKNDGEWSETGDHPLDHIRKAIKDSYIDIVSPDVPPMAMSGLFGYMGYDMVRLVEDSVPDNNPDDLGLADSILMRPTILVIFDNVKNMICVVTPIYSDDYNADHNAASVYADASYRIHEVIENLEDDSTRTGKYETALSLPLDVGSNTTREEYHATVKKAVDYIHEGEVFQVVPGQRFNTAFDLPSFALYRSLRHLNPSPFMFHLAFEGFSIVGSSPEILVRVRDNTITIRPIAGTRPRGKDAAEDGALAEDLLGDEKERAEHLMLLDLGRNDVGKAAKTGTVKVTDSHVIERYSHVMHIVSNVEGELDEDLDILDALLAGFPAGTVSGAPKVRAMQIIDELEKNRRGVYGGAVGYLSGNGTLDTCIALRTAVVKDGTIYVQAGGGVVADSSPEGEYQETINKSRAILAAAEAAVKKAKKI